LDIHGWDFSWWAYWNHVLLGVIWFTASLTFKALVVATTGLTVGGLSILLLKKIWYWLLKN
jgi:hypothetical protein